MERRSAIKQPPKSFSGRVGFKTLPFFFVSWGFLQCALYDTLPGPKDHERLGVGVLDASNQHARGRSGSPNLANQPHQSNIAECV